MFVGTTGLERGALVRLRSILRHDLGVSLTRAVPDTARENNLLAFPALDHERPVAVLITLRAYPNNPLFTNLIDPSHEVLWTIVMGGFDGRLADTL